MLSEKETNIYWAYLCGELPYAKKMNVCIREKGIDSKAVTLWLRKVKIIRN